MTLRATQPHDERPVVQESDLIPAKRAVLIAVIFLFLFTVATLWAFSLLRTEEGKLDPQPVIPSPRQIGKPQIGMVNQRLFELQLEAKEKREGQLRRLNSYGWVDRDKQIIHIPIDRAMELLSAEQRQ